MPHVVKSYFILFLFHSNIIKYNINRLRQSKKNLEIMYHVAESISINANYTCVYNEYIDDGTAQRFLRPGRAVNFFDNFHDCQMSTGAIKTIKKCVNTILYLAHRYHMKNTYRKKACTGYRQNEVSKKHNPKYMCTFLTLTLPSEQRHTDDEIVRHCLNPFLVYARKYFHVKYYIWKKELQQNGNIHFHLVTDKFIDHAALRRAWNRVINKGAVAGVKNPFDYVDRYTAKQKAKFVNGWNEQQQRAEFARSPQFKMLIRTMLADKAKELGRQLTGIESKILVNNLITNKIQPYKNYVLAELRKPAAEQWTSPNSTDISAVKSGRMVSAYCAKYLSKEIEAGNTRLKRYISLTEHIKNKIFRLMKFAEWRKANGLDYTDIADQINTLKNKLYKYRDKHCKINGALWYKSRTLTPFVSGARDFMNLDINEDLKKVVVYLFDIQQKTGKKMILEDEDRGTIVLLIQAAEFKRLKAWSLYKMYDDYIKDGILQNINNAARRSEARRLRNQNKAA